MLCICSILKIRIHVLKSMNQKELADTLEKSHYGELALCQHNLKSHLKMRSEYLFEALSSNPSHLRELNLDYSHVGDSGVKILSAALEHPDCNVKLSVNNHAEHWYLQVSGLKKYAYELTLDPNTAH
ncbi:hypothetical protein J4Q44_G00024730 [Coregonus suidteri]|uniref:Uncharacterized protein n=1 Tax=Coregonus suidteri TaxID=861788 RepID=A0AAN8MHC1_9TELE